MSWLLQTLNYLVHIDTQLDVLLLQSGPLFWGIVFLALFAETGFVVTSFLPGETLVFAAGALVARSGGLNIWWVLLILGSAAITGNTANYWIGHTIGRRMLKNGTSKVLKQVHIDRTRAFFARYGEKTVLFARFVPFARTLAPFLAGVGEMKYRDFVVYDIAGGVTWVTLFLFGGFLFGGIPFVKNNLMLVLIAIIVIAAIPVVIGSVRRRHISSVVAA